MRSKIHVRIGTCLLLLAWACSHEPTETDGPGRVGDPAQRGSVSSASPEATEAGLEILEAGGNAVDAAVAVSFALGVTEPAMSGLGGQTQIILFRPGGRTLVINGTSRAPSGTPGEVSADDLRWHRATTIPSTVRVLEYAQRNFGSGALVFSELLAPAIRYAEEGFVLGSFRRLVLERHADDLRAGPGVAKLFLTADGSLPPGEEAFRQPVLARTLHRLADAGALGFYRGDIAADIAEDMQANGGWLTRDDLEVFPEPSELEPLHGSYRGYDIWTLPPPGGGWVVLQILHKLEAVDATELRLGSPQRAVHLARALSFAHGSRATDPIPDLMHYEEAVRERIDKERLRSVTSSRGETTHFSIVDGEGMAVSVTASVNAYYGAWAASPELGFVYNDYMHEFELGVDDHPYALRPNGLPYSSMSPTIVTRDGELQLVLGSPGSSRIVSAVAQVIQAWVDDGQDIQAAVAAPRVHASGSKDVYLERRNAAIEAMLVEEGFRLVEPSEDLANDAGNPYFGGVHAIGLGPTGWLGVADPRRDGVARAYQPAKP